MRYKTAAFVLLLSVPLFLTGCTLSDLPVIGRLFKGKDKPVTLTYWGLWEPSPVMQALIDKYRQAHPGVTINYEDRSVMDLNTYKERVFERAKQSSGPDIVRVHNSWVGGLRELLAPMPDKMMALGDYSNAFYPVVSNDSVYNGSIYSMPLYYDGLVLVYNKDHFDEIGQVGAPTAWEELRRLALELSVRSGEGGGEALLRGGIALGAANNIDHFSDILGLMWSQAGVEIPDGLSTKAAQDALAFYLNFVREDGVWSADFPEAKTAFVNGQVSMILVPSWGILDILNAAPDMNIGVAPAPQALPDTPVTWASYWTEVVPANGENAKAAWEFLNFLAREEQQRMLFSEAQKGRAFGAPYSLVSLGAELADNAYLSSAVRTAPYGVGGEIAARSGNKKQVDALKAAVNSVLGKEMTEDEALARAQKALSSRTE